VTRSRLLSSVPMLLSLAALRAAAADDAVPPQLDLKREAERIADASSMPGEIVVSAARGVPLTYAGGRDVIEEETLNRYPDQNFSTVLRRVPGVVIMSENGNDSRLNIGIRGNDARRSGLTTILIDGVPISEAPYGNTDVDGLPVAFERVSRIDVIRGGASIRWGPNSAGGVINIVTEQIPDAPTAKVASRYGSNRDWSVSTAAGGKWDKFGVLINVVDKGGDGFRENSDYSDQDGSAKFSWQFTERDVLRVGISRFTEIEAEQPGGLTEAAYREDPDQSLRPGFDFTFTSNVYQADFVHQVSKDSSLQVIGWYHEGFRGLFDFRPIVAPYTVDRNQNSDFSSEALEVRYTWTTKLLGMRHSFFHSARYLTEKNREYYERVPFATGVPNRPLELDANFQGNAFSFFTDDTIALRDDLSLAVGGRSETIDMKSDARDPSQPALDKRNTYDELLPTASLTWTAVRDVAIYGSWQQNFLTPQYETGFDPTSAAYRPIDPEHSESYELGTRVRAVPGLEFAAAFFRTDFTDKIDFVNQPNGTKIAMNTGEARSQGVELSASYDFGKACEDLKGLSVFGTATNMRSRAESGVNDGNDIPNSPHTLGSWGVLYEHCSGAWARIGGSYTSSSFKDPENFTAPQGTNGVTGPQPGYTLWDAAIGWHQNPDGTGFAVTVGVTNLFDAPYYRRFVSGIYPGAPRQEFVSASYTMSW